MHTNSNRVQFWIDIDHGDLQYRFLVYFYKAESTEYFEVTAGQRHLLIASNRPVLHKQGNPGMPTYSLVEGSLTKPGLLDKIFEALNDHVEEYRY